MNKKKSMLLVSMIAIIVLTLTPVSLVRAEDIRLEPVSGSDCDPTTFEYQGHTIAEGFAVSTSADLPFEAITQIKFGGAVAGLGDPWVESGFGVYIEFTPYVKEMWVKVEGDPPYTAIEDTIYDNTGTGGSSLTTFGVIMLALDIAFATWQIYDWLAEIYQEPPVAEWDYNGHWSEAIVRQKTEQGYYPYQQYVNPDNPRLQTASANVWGYFYEGSSRGLSVTAQAEIYLQKDSKLSLGIVHEYIGTYEVSFEVSVPVSVYTLTIQTTTGGTTEPPSGTYMYDYGSSVTVTASGYSGYAFNYWLLDGATEYANPITVTMDSDHDLTAYFVELVNLVVKVPRAPPEGVNVWVDGDEYKAYADAPASVMVEAGEHTIEVQKIFIKSDGTTNYIFTFDHWSDGSTDNPRTIHLTSDTTLTAYYVRSKTGIQSEEPE